MAAEIDVAAILAAQRQAARDAVRAFLSALTTGDTSALRGAWSALSDADAWRTALLRCRRLTNISRATRMAVLDIWIESGPELREDAAGDVAMIDALRAILPSYTGGPLVLYRGESARNRKRRTYGMSWTTSRETAEEFAEASRRIYAAGSVIVRSEVPAEAIICAIHEHDARYQETEYLVDRRQLGAVIVERRYPQLEL